VHLSAQKHGHLQLTLILASHLFDGMHGGSMSKKHSLALLDVARMIPHATCVEFHDEPISKGY